MPTLLGVFDRPDQIAAAAQRLRDRGYGDIETYSPAPFAEVDDAVIEQPSRVRLFTLIGGLTGVVTGYALTLWMANDWPIIVGGKPFSSVTPYTIIAFELTILFGVLMTVIGLFVFGRIPSFRLDPGYTARFSGEEFGLAVRCRDRDVAEIDGLLRDHDATEVSLVEA
jgi:molybdopterin-containing oxidoreductase family membrane subunit